MVCGAQQHTQVVEETLVTAPSPFTFADYDSADQPLNLRSLFRMSYDADLQQTPQLIEAFWAVLDAWKPDMQRSFLEFVTGLRVPPPPGAEQLRFEVPYSTFSDADHERVMHFLPQSHVCVTPYILTATLLN